jgi:hypothetical protein
VGGCAGGLSTDRKCQGRARRALGDKTFSAMFDEGTSLTLDQAIAFVPEEAPSV